MRDVKVQSADTQFASDKARHLLSLRRSAPKMVILTLFGFTALITAAQPTRAATVGTTIGGTPFANLCTAGITLPTLAPVADTGLAGVGTLLSTLGLGGVTTAVDGLTSGINSNVITPLNGAQLSLGALGNNVTANAALSGGNCNVATTGLGVTNNQGITIGGGQISGLGGTTSAQASAGDLSAIAFGNGSSTFLGSVNAIAVGTNASALGTGSVALGANALATAPGGVALGTGSTVVRTAITVPVADPTALASAPTTVTTTTGAVSVGTLGGERQITNVAAGTSTTDAVNVGQITPLTAAINTQVAQDVVTGNSVATALGGGSAYNATTGAISAPLYTVGGLPYASVGTAIGAQNTISGNTGAGLTAALGGGSSYVAATGTIIPPSYTVDGSAYTNVGSALAASNANAPVKYSTAVTPTVANNGVPTQNVTLVGASALSPVGLHDVAAGVLSAVSTDAVNGSQLYATGSTLASALGGTATFNASTGAISAPSFTVGGVAYPSVGLALGAENALVGATGASLATTIGGGTVYNTSTGALSTPSFMVDGTTYTTIGSALAAAASDGPVQYSNPGTPTVGNGGTPTQSETLVGASASTPVALHNLAAGSVAALSTDAVNGGQLNTAASSVATALGGTTTFNATTGALTAPSFAVGGVAYPSVGLALGAENGIVGTTGANLAATLGGGTTYTASTGALSTPNYTVDGQVYTNIGSALAAAGNNGPVQYSNPGTPTIGNGGTPTQSETLVGALGGVPVALHNLAAGTLGAASTDAVNGSQLYATGSTLAAALGGTTTFNVATGALTTPSYTIDGQVYTNLGSAVLAAGNNGPVQYSNPGTPTTGNGGTPTQSETLVGALGGVPVSLHNLAAGVLSGVSTDAVNGSQLYATGASLAADLGGTSTFNAATGQVSTPVYTVGGVNFSNVGAAISAQNTISHNSETGLTAALGGGASYNTATGVVSAPTYTVGGNTYTNVGSALTAAASGVGSPVQYSTSVTPTTPDGGVPSQDVTLVGLLPGVPVALHNVAAGALTGTSTDAVNGSQLYAAGASLASDLGGGAALNPLTGMVSAPSYTVGGLSYANVGLAIAAQNGISGASEAGLTTALGGGASYNPATGVVTAPNYTVGGNVYTNVGAAIDAAAAGVGSPVQYSTGLAPTTPNGGVPSQDVTLVGALAGVPVAVHNVAAGALTSTSTDAVNGGQLYATGASLASALGGGATLDPTTGQVSAPTYSVGGLPYIGVSAAIGAQNAISGATGGTVAAALGGGTVYNAATGAISGPTYTIGGSVYTNVGAALAAAASGVGMPVQYSTALAPTTPDGGLASQDVTLVGAVAGTPVALHNLAAGALTPLSTDAVNGGQLYATGSSLATALGGGATLDPLTGQVSAPAYTVGGQSYNNVGAAIGAQNTISGNTGAGVIAALGGGAIYNPATGAVTGPSYVVGGNAYTNVGSAIAAAASGVGGPVQYSTALAPTTSNGGVASQDETLVGAVGGVPVALHNLAPGALTALSTDAVNGGQLYATGSSLASALGGGSTLDAATGLVSAPLYTVGGLTYNSVGGAIGAQNTISVNTGGSLTAALGGGTTYNPATGTVSTPAYVIGANTYTSVGSALAAVAAAGADGPVQYSTSLAPTTPNGGTPSQDETLVGATAGTPVTLHNLANGSLSDTSSDAINGSQLYATGSSLASALGGGSAFNTSTGAVSAPNYTVQNTNYTSVGGAISALNLGLTSVQTPGSEYFHANSTGTDSSATGSNAVAIGVGNTAIGSNALAAGANATAMNAGSTALGSGAVAGSSVNGSTTNAQNTAVGVNSSAMGISTTALGANATAMGTSSIALGTSAVAMDLSTAIGNTATTMATASVAIGDGAKAGDPTAVGVNLQAGVAIGVVSTAMARATAVGNGSGAMGFGSTAVGASAMAMDTGSTAIGQFATANGASSVALGTNSTAAANSTAIGDSSTTMAAGSIALGTNAKAGDATQASVTSQAGVAVGVASTAMGNGTALGNASTAMGQGSSAVGQSANATGVNATAVGINATAMTDNSVAVGSQATAGGGSAVSVGYQNTAMGNGAVAVGDPDTAMGEGATAVGENETATGDGTVAIGDGNSAIGQGAVALGYFSNALGAGSLAFGDTATASLANDIALGTNSTASGGNSLALGAGATATNAFGVALGAGSVGSANNNTAGSVVTGNFVSLNYDNSANTLVGAVSIGSAGAYRQLSNVADGVAAHDAVTVEQLAAVVTQTDTAITTINTRLATGGTGGGTGTTGAQAVQYSTAAAPTTPSAVVSNDATLVGATTGGVALHDLAAGTLSAASTDAVNGSQLFTTNTEVATLAATQNGVAVNSAMGPATATGTETAAVGGGSQATGANTVALGSGAIATGANSVALGAGSTDGGQTGVVSVGSAGAQRKIVNVAAGAVNAASTDAVNGSQLYTVAQQSANAVQYGTDASGARTNTVALVGGNAAAPVTLANVAAGAVTAASTDAVNGSQLYGASQTAASALTLAQNSVQYDDATHASATLNSGGTATTLHNVAAGTALTDATNVGQLNAAMASAVSTSNAYTDSRFNVAMNSIWKVKQEAYAATAGAMAAAGLPQAHGTGKTLVSMAVGAWEGQSAYALGMSRLSANGVWIVKGSVSFNTQGQGGANVGIGFEF